jgi:putative protease
MSSPFLKEFNPEIMAPAGNRASLTAAAQAGAGSVYLGVGNLNMRAHAAHNFSVEDLPQIVAFCREHNIRSYLTVNTIFYDQDLPELKHLLGVAKEAGITAVIASDMAAILEARSLDIEVHISTQLNVSNIQALSFYAQYAEVIVLARELTLEQIGEIARQVRERNITGPSGNRIRLELFCHGALCMAVSGKCYLSLHEYNKSANRGSCYQICRRSYTVTDNETGAELEVDNKYIMSPKDLCTITFLDKILEAGIEVLKIEGRARSPEYVKTTVQAYKRGVRAVLEGTYTPELGKELETQLKTVFNRGFWGGYYLGRKPGEWSDAYGNQATEKKVYIARVTNYFSRSGIAELKVETAPLHVGDKVMIIGPTTGVVEDVVREIRLNDVPVQSAPQGAVCSVPCAQKLRRSDKLYRIDIRD